MRGEFSARVIAVVLLLVGLARAEPPPEDEWKRPPKRRLVLTSLLAARYNALGLEEIARLADQRELYGSGSPFLRENFFAVGLSTRFAPTYARVGPFIEIQPVSFFSLRLTADAIGMFQSFGYWQSFASPAAVWSDSALKAGNSEGHSYSTWAVHAAIEPTLMVRFPVGRIGHLALRDRLLIEYWKADLRVRANGVRDTVFYDGTLDTLLSADGWVIQNDLDVVLMLRSRWNVGVRYTAMVPLYQTADFTGPAEAQSWQGSNAQQRVGPLLAYTFFDRGFTAFNKPTLILLANWYLQHRFRTGQDTSEALPYLALAFSFVSDLL